MFSPARPGECEKNVCRAVQSASLQPAVRSNNADNYLSDSDHISERDKTNILSELAIVAELL